MTSRLKKVIKQDPKIKFLFVQCNEKYSSKYTEFQTITYKIEETMPLPPFLEKFHDIDIEDINGVFSSEGYIFTNEDVVRDDIYDNVGYKITNKEIIYMLRKDSKWSYSRCDCHYDDYSRNFDCSCTEQSYYNFTFWIMSEFNPIFSSKKIQEDPEIEIEIPEEPEIETQEEPEIQEELIETQEESRKKLKLPNHIAAIILTVEPDCSICFDKLSKITINISLCGHYYCTECFDQISICSICKQDLVTI